MVENYNNYKGEPLRVYKLVNGELVDAEGEPHKASAVHELTYNQAKDVFEIGNQVWPDDWTTEEENKK